MEEIKKLLLYNYDTDYVQKKKQQNKNIKSFSKAINVYLKTGIVNNRLKILIQSGKLIEARYRMVCQEVDDLLKNKVDYTIELRDKMFGLMEESSYLSQLQCILSIYYEEHNNREEKKQFQYFSRNNTELPFVVKSVANTNRTIESLEKEIVHIDIWDLVKMNTELFRVTKRESGSFLTLSPKGNRYHKFVSCPQMMDAESCQKLSYKNSYAIIEAISSFLEQDNITPPKIELIEMDLMQENAIRREYSMLAKKIGFIKRKEKETYCPIQIRDIMQDGYMRLIGGNNERISNQLGVRAGREG